jgi:hypothetical protein
MDRVPTTSPKETMLVFGKRREVGLPLERAVEAASGLKAGTWTSVEALTWLVRAGRELGKVER